MAHQEPPVVIHAALRQLREEARHRLAALEPRAPERDFYVGVMTAAEDLSRPGHSVMRSLAHESPTFRDGYLEVADLVGAAAGHTPSRLPVPTPKT